MVAARTGAAAPDLEARDLGAPDLAAARDLGVGKGLLSGSRRGEGPAEHLQF